MKKEHAMALFFGLIMISSVAGFALSGYTTANRGGSSPTDVPNIVTTALSNTERLSIFQSGKMLLQFHYNLNCSACSETQLTLENFAKNNTKSIVLEEFAIPDNETMVFRMISPTGQIEDLPSQVNDSVLFDTFCSISYVQTKECLMRNIQ